MTVLSDTEIALPDEFVSPREIHKRLGRWAVVSVRHALAILHAQGRAEREERWPVSAKFARQFFYRRARLPQRGAA